MLERTKNDRELLRASLQGSPKAFGVLVGRYQSLVCAITYSATGSVERSEELAQEQERVGPLSPDKQAVRHFSMPWACL